MNGEELIRTIDDLYRMFGRDISFEISIHFNGINRSTRQDWKPAHAQSQQTDGEKGNNKMNNGYGSNGSTATQKQVTAIFAISRKLGLSTDDVRRRCMDVYNRMPEHLDKNSASDLITSLSNELNGAR